MRFSDKIILVVGGNSGIGLASAQAFAAEGAIVRISGRDQATIDAAVATIPGAKGYRADIAAARTGTDAATASLTAAITAEKSAVAAHATAEKQLADADAPAREEDLAVDGQMDVALLSRHPDVQAGGSVGRPFLERALA